ELTPNEDTRHHADGVALSGGLGDSGAMQISELMNELLEARAERVVPGTLARDRWLVGLINSGIGDVEIESITARDLHRWAVELREVVAPSSAEAAVGLVRRAFRWG